MGSSTKKCPFCAEEIKEDAIKCRFCNSFLNTSKNKIKLKANDHDSYNMITFVCFLFPLIGFIIGIVYLTKNNPLDKKLGEHALGISVLFAILWYVVAFVVFGLTFSSDILYF